jgi:hypothetical protein
MSRSSLPATRNPLLLLPAARKIADLPQESKVALRDLLIELSTEAQRRASESWRKHKAPMAAYWKAVAVYSRHLSRLLR